MVCSYTSPRKYELEEEYVKRMIKIGYSMRPNPNELEEEYAKRMMKHGINGPLHLNPNELAEPNELEVAYVKGMIKINGPTFPIGTFA
jgi:predicted TIM-barrel fold metal-dependent hydrolase